MGSSASSKKQLDQKEDKVIEQEYQEQTQPFKHNLPSQRQPTSPKSKAGSQTSKQHSSRSPFSQKAAFQHEILSKFKPQVYRPNLELKLLIADVEGKLGLYHNEKFQYIFQHLEKLGPIIDNKGMVYTGQWCQGHQCGYGEQYHNKENIYYIGYFFMGQYHGHGRMIYEDGDYYEGEWFMGKPYNSGNFYNKRGQLIETINPKSLKDFQDNQPTLIENTSVYYGSLQDQKKSGLGLQLWENGTYYLGSFENDKKQGLGEMQFCNGDRYVGGFSDNQFSNTGHFQWQDGRLYFGKYKDGLKDGIGIYRDQNIYFEGFFVKGKMHGRGSITDIKTGFKKFSHWEDGKQLTRQEILKRKLDV